MYLRSAERSFYPAWHVPEYGKSQDATRSHIVVGDVEFPEAREVRQPVQTSRSGPQSVAGEVELGQAVKCSRLSMRDISGRRRTEEGARLALN